MIIFSRELNVFSQPSRERLGTRLVFSIENVLFQILDVTKRMSRMTKHVSKAGKVDPCDRVTLLVKFACKQELTLTRLLG